MPRLVHNALAREDRSTEILLELQRLREAQEHHTRLLGSVAVALGAVALMMAWYFSGLPLP